MISTLNCLVTLFGAFFAWLVKKEKEKLTCVALGCSVGIIIATSFFSLLLPAKEILNVDTFLHHAILPLGCICGILLSRTCNRLFPHDAIIPCLNKKGTTEKHGNNKLLMLAMTLHNIPEGMAIGISIAAATYSHYLPALALAMGIGIQNFFEGSAVYLEMHRYSKNTFTAIINGQFCALVEIPCAFIGFILAMIAYPILPILLSLIAGSMLFVCIEELVPKANRNGNIDISTSSCIAGFFIVILFDIMLF
jgi:Predicted divalent heavy-metal cations transporter